MLHIKLSTFFLTLDGKVYALDGTVEVVRARGLSKIG